LSAILTFFAIETLFLSCLPSSVRSNAASRSSPASYSKSRSDSEMLSFDSWRAYPAIPARLSLIFSYDMVLMSRRVLADLLLFNSSLLDDFWVPWVPRVVSCLSPPFASFLPVLCFLRLMLIFSSGIGMCMSMHVAMISLSSTMVRRLSR